MTKEEELAELHRKLKNRRGRSGLESNVRAIEQRIAELEAQE